MVSVEALKKRKINYFVPRIVLKTDKKKKKNEDHDRNHDQENPLENEGDTPITDSGEDDDNSEVDNSDQSNSDSDDNSDNEDEGENINNINELPENIQVIARLPLSQAQQKTEQEIEKLLKDNGISEQELNQEKLLGGTD
jgi:hypothetical protein